MAAAGQTGTRRADGYTRAVGSRISGPSDPARGQRAAASSRASMAPGCHATSGLATTTNSDGRSRLGDPAIRGRAVADVPADAQQPHAGMTRDRGLGSAVGGAVVGQDDLRFARSRGHVSRK